jgi:hypothetical protein
MSATPDFAGCLRDIRDIKAEARAHELALVDQWRADVDIADAAVVRDGIGQLVKQSCAAIAAAEPLSDDEVVVLCVALFRALQSGAHVERTRDALACLSDIVSDFSAGPVPDPIDDDDDEGSACDQRQDERRDRAIETAAVLEHEAAVAALVKGKAS